MDAIPVVLSAVDWREVADVLGREVERAEAWAEERGDDEGTGLAEIAEVLEHIAVVRAVRSAIVAAVRAEMAR